ncbi:serine/threonine protein kinase [Xylanimonas allomyrinae]|uniref:non-specific serine/threonine protein kinase n=1 Tax=Xylanimonas allomyrinae TaxID=2509459 RepID=A0A4V0YDZ6_9MICO|nr:RIO1 family regulatory kinase/ATPase [Xylanimonas allomyrinae]QAY62441.1 serine/threonine protein kinase [Xylanimonas allomyrinae]
MSVPDTPDLPAPGTRWSTWATVAKGQRGPQPYPSWVVTDAAALDTELGILKTGKEADVHLVERAVPDDPARWSLLAAKRYRSQERRDFDRDDSYTEGRKLRRTRDQRAAEDRKSAYGRSVRAGHWAHAEFAALCALWEAGAPVPYPVQLDGTEILLQFVGSPGDDGAWVAAPRLAQVRPPRDVVAGYLEQIRDAMGVFARLGWAHGDLSPYNVLADGERLVVIDVPQVVDLAASPFAVEYLHRDCVNMCAWFAARGVEADPEELFADVYAQAW